jgi:AcrR family transcriptional regulator
MADDKATRIMEAAERLMARRRYHEVTTDDIAREAKVGKGTIYRHFRDKDDLFHQAAVRGFDDLCSLLKADLAPGEPVREQLLRACERIGGFFRGRRQWLGLAQAEDARMAMCRGRLKEQWRAHRLRLVAVVSELLTAGAEAGLVRRDLPPEMMAAMLLGMLRARARDLADVPEADRTYAMVVDLFLGGAAAPCDGDRK